MEEADQDAAVGHAAFQADLAGSAQAFFQRQPAQAIRVICHALRVTAIASKNQSAQLAGTGPAGKARRAVAEVKVRPNDLSRVSAPVLEPLPARILAKILGLAVDRDLIQPHLATCGRGLHNVKEAKTIERRAVFFMSFCQMAHGFNPVYGGSNNTAPAVTFRIVIERPAMHRSLGGKAFELGAAGLWIKF